MIRFVSIIIATIIDFTAVSVIRQKRYRAFEFFKSMARNRSYVNV